MADFNKDIWCIEISCWAIGQMCLISKKIISCTFVWGRELETFPPIVTQIPSRKKILKNTCGVNGRCYFISYRFLPPLPPTFCFQSSLRMYLWCYPLKTDCIWDIKTIDTDCIVILKQFTIQEIGDFSYQNIYACIIIFLTTIPKLTVLEICNWLCHDKQDNCRVWLILINMFLI